MSSSQRGPELLMVAGEASGDLHGGRLLTELRRLVPGLRAFGMGGEEMAAAGLETVADSSDVSVVGITEALKVVRRAREIFHRLLDEVVRRGTRSAVLIDFPDFNLRLAKKLSRRGVSVVYYVSPQVWAWRRGRVRSIARIVDKMLVLFPFEVDFYRRHGVEVVHVGHPLVDEVPEMPQTWDHGPPRDEPYRVALLPGSRRSEVAALLPVMLRAVAALAERLPIHARVIRAPSIPRSMVEEALALEDLPVRVLDAARGGRFQAVADSHLALCASGTATLETGLLGTPLVVVYRLAGWTYWLARLLVRLPHVALVNLVLERRAVPELIQGDATPQRIADEAERLLRDPERVATVRRDLADLRPRLGRPGASLRAAREVAAMLGVSETRAETRAETRPATVGEGP
jgi:lipid-A-disaccharide synthase